MRPVLNRLVALWLLAAPAQAGDLRPTRERLTAALAQDASVFSCKKAAEEAAAFKPKERLALAEALRKARPNCWPLAAELARALAAAGRGSEAALQAQALAAAHPEVDEARLAAAEILEEAGALEEAGRQYASVVQSSDRFDLYLRAAARLRAVEDESRLVLYERLRQEWEARTLSGSDDVKPWRLLAQEYKLAAHAPKQRALCAAALEKFAQVRDFSECLEESLWALGDFTALERSLRTRLKSPTAGEKDWLALADVFAEQGLWDRAREVLLEGARDVRLGGGAQPLGGGAQPLGGPGSRLRETAQALEAMAGKATRARGAPPACVYTPGPPIWRARCANSEVAWGEAPEGFSFVEGGAPRAQPAEADPTSAARLAARLLEAIEAARFKQAPPATPPSPETIEALRKAGYLRR